MRDFIKLLGKVGAMKLLVLQIPSMQFHYYFHRLLWSHNIDAISSLLSNYIVLKEFIIHIPYRHFKS